MRPDRTKKAKSSEDKNKLMWKIHHWAGFYSGIVIAVLCITGSMATFIPEIDHFIRKTYYAAQSTPSEEWHFEKSITELTDRYPTYQSIRIKFPDKPGYAGLIDLEWKENGEIKANRSSFFVDMGQDRLLGRRNHQNTIANYLRQIHVRLYESNWGRYLVGIAGFCFVLVTITGLLIYGKFMKRQQFPQVRQGRGLRFVMVDWHKLLGIATLAFNLMIALTGTWLGLQGWFKVKNPGKYKPAIIMDKLTDLHLSVKWQDILKSTKHNFPDLMARDVVISNDGSATITVSGNIRGQIYERSINYLVLSKQNLQPQFKYDVRQKPFGHKFYFIQEALHFGDYGGIALKLLYASLGLVAAFLAISGFVIYLFRTEKKQKRVSSPMKITFLYGTCILLLLFIIALVSTLVGYSSATYIMAIIIDGGLFVLCFYFSIKSLKAFLRKIRTKS